MPYDKLASMFALELEALKQAGTAKGRETVITGIIPPAGDKGPRYLLEGAGDQPFLRMNSNSYLGLSLQREVKEAEEHAVRAYGTGPGAVRFISGTWAPHVALEDRLAAFHGREGAMIFSSAYATVMGVLPSRVDAGNARLSAPV
jgi:glycine C-acetyltransferase